MTIHPIRTDADHARALEMVDSLWTDEAPAQGTAEADYLEVLFTLIDLYEQEHHAISAPSAIEAIKFRMEQQGLSRTDLIPILGSSPRVSEVLSGKRSLSRQMMLRLEAGLGLPASVLLGSVAVQPSEFVVGQYRISAPDGSDAGAWTLRTSTQHEADFVVDGSDLRLRFTTFLRSPIQQVVKRTLASAEAIVARSLSRVGLSSSGTKALLRGVRPQLQREILSKRRSLLDNALAA